MSEESTCRIDDGEWYHGSPEELTVLHVGSTITRDRELARVFSHKPSLVSQGYANAQRHIKHSGTCAGYLYRVAELVVSDDVRPHPTTTMGAGQEWLTNRELRVELIGPTAVRDDERLTPEETAELLVRTAASAKEKHT